MLWFKKKRKADFYLLPCDPQETYQHACFVEQQFITLSENSGINEKKALFVTFDPPIEANESLLGQQVDCAILLPLHRQTNLFHFAEPGYKTSVIAYAARTCDVNDGYLNIDGLKNVGIGVVEKKYSRKKKKA